MFKNLQSEIVGYIRSNPLLLFYSILGTGILCSIIYGGSEVQFKQEMAFAYMLALPVCLGGEYLVADKALGKRLIGPLVVLIFLIGFALVRALSAPASLQLHLLATTFLLFLLIPRAVRQDERLGFHWTIHILFAVGASISISGILLGLASFLAWVVKELFHIKLLKVVNDFGISFFAIFLPINIFAFLKPQPEQVAHLRYHISKSIEKMIKVLFIPALLIYLIVLLSYTLKIVIQLKLPQGMVSIPISVAYGLFSIIDAYIESQDRKLDGLWRFRNWIRASFAPLFVIMSIGIAVRITQYGLTPDRVYLVMGFLFMIASAAVRLRWNRLELRKLLGFAAVLMLVTSAGPSNPANWSARSQTRRFIETLQKYGTTYESVADFKFSTWTLADIATANTSLNVIRTTGKEEELVNKAKELGVFSGFPKESTLKDTLAELQSQLSHLDTTDVNNHNRDYESQADQKVCQSYRVQWSNRPALSDIRGFHWRIEFALGGKTISKSFKIPERNEVFRIKLDSQSLDILKGSESVRVIDFGNKIREQVALEGASFSKSPLILEGRHKGTLIKMIILEADIDCTTPSIEGEFLVRFPQQ